MDLVTLLHDSPSGSYSQSVSSICDFVSWIESQAPTPYPANIPYTNAFNAFNTMKQDAMKWYNSIYPNCIQILDAICFDNTQVMTGLDTMLSVVEQLRDNPDNEELHSMVVKNAQMLYETVSKVKDAGQKIEDASISFFDAINGDFVQISNSRNALAQEMQIQQNNLSAMYANLHAIKSKSCPSQGDINACQSQINNQQILLGTLSNLMAITDKAMSMANLTLQGLTYLKNFWSLITSDAENCLTSLNAITTDPTVLLNIDIQNAQNAWKELYDIASQTLAQLPQALKQNIN